MGWGLVSSSEWIMGIPIFQVRHPFGTARHPFGFQGIDLGKPTKLRRAPHWSVGIGRFSGKYEGMIPKTGTGTPS